MVRRAVPAILALAAIAGGAGAAALRDAFLTEPDQVVELAPGVWFRHGDIGKGHSNNGFVLFRDFVLVIDANFPSGAEACMAQIRKVTDKPVRLVFDTHHHGDHAYGNPLWMKAGALPVSYVGVADEMRRVEPARWRSEKRPDMAALALDAPLPPVITYPDRLVIDDGTRRVELLHFGTAHTRGDGFAYLPREKVIFTGDVVVEGPYNYLGDGDSASWIETIDALKRLDVEIVAGGHGRAGDRGMIDRQRKFLVELRARVAAGIAVGKGPEEIAGTIRFPDDVKGYMGDFLRDQVGKVHREMLGLEMPYELVRLGLEEGASPAKGDPGWTAPSKVVLAGPADWLPALRRVAPGVTVVAAEGGDLLREIAEADGFIGDASADAIAAGKRLRWIQPLSPPGASGRPPGGAGIERCIAPAAGEEVFRRLGAKGEELQGKTIVIGGGGPVAAEIARRAEAFRMGVMAGGAGGSEPTPGAIRIEAGDREVLAAAARSPMSLRRLFLLARENLRRFAAGERLLETGKP